MQCNEIEKSIITVFRKNIWAKFAKAIVEYNMIQSGDRIAVCISGGKDSFLLAKCFQELKKHGTNNFELKFLSMNPGYNKENEERIIKNSKNLNIPINMFETDIFERVYSIKDKPCYLCARMRRGHLYENAKKLNCNKIALGHHFDDVIETIIMGILYGGQYQTMMPKLKSTSHPGMELIRPLYLVREADIISWQNKNNLDFIKCGCKMTEKYVNNYEPNMISKREEIKKLLSELRKKDNLIDMNIFRSAQNVNTDAVLCYKKAQKKYNFLDNY